MKSYHIQRNVGSARYVVSYHDGQKKHKDGSAFFDIAIFRNQEKLKSFTKQLESKGYESN